MTPDDLTGRTYGPAAARASAELVAGYVTATSDDVSRWERFAPPGFASVLMFAVAPVFLADAGSVFPGAATVHLDQVFAWERALPVDTVVSVTGAVESVRHRGDLVFVTFTTRAGDGDGPYLSSTATFLLAAGKVGSERLPEEAEPAWDERAACDELTRLPPPAAGEPVPPLIRSASRADLVRYAGASGDFNPIHWDHTAAVEAGFPGVIAHGLLIAAWVAQAAARFGDGPVPLSSLRLRFRRPLRPGPPAAIGGNVRRTGDGTLDLALTVTAGEVELVTADATVAAG